MLYCEQDRQKANKLTQNQWHHHSAESELICPVMQQSNAILNQFRAPKSRSMGSSMYPVGQDLGTIKASCLTV